MAKRTRKNAADDIDQYEIVNPSEADGWSRTHLYLMWFGAYRDGRVLVWADSFDAAFETAVDYFDDPKSCGVFTFTDESDYKASAEDEGIEWPAGGWDDLSERDQEKVREAAEADLTVIGHTTLSCMPKGAWGAFVASWEWGGDDITGDDMKYIRAKSLAAYDQADELEKLGWRMKPGTIGVWTAEFSVGDADYDVFFFDQRAVYAASGGSGKRVGVEIYQRKGTAPIKTKMFDDMGSGSVASSDPMLWVDEIEDELNEAAEE